VRARCTRDSLGGPKRCGTTAARLFERYWLMTLAFSPSRGTLRARPCAYYLTIRYACALKSDTRSVAREVNTACWQHMAGLAGHTQSNNLLPAAQVVSINYYLRITTYHLPITIYQLPCCFSAAMDLSCACHRRGTPATSSPQRCASRRASSAWPARSRASVSVQRNGMTSGKES